MDVRNTAAVGRALRGGDLLPGPAAIGGLVEIRGIVDGKCMLIVAGIGGKSVNVGNVSDARGLLVPMSAVIGRVPHTRGRATGDEVPAPERRHVFDVLIRRPRNGVMVKGHRRVSGGVAAVGPHVDLVSAG